MDLTQSNVPSTGELGFLALEQAYANSLAMQENTQKQIDRLLNGFQHLEKLMQAAKILPSSPKICPANLTPIQSSPTRQPPPLALPSKYDGNHSKGQAFLTSCQMYIGLCPDSFLEEHIKITWALSYMKSRQVAKWAEQIFQWEEKHRGYLKFLDWEEFCKEFWKDFCLAHSDIVAINKLDSTSYYQKSWSVDDYLDEFVELIAEVVREHYVGAYYILTVSISLSPSMVYERLLVVSERSLVLHPCASLGRYHTLYLLFSHTCYQDPG